MDCLTHGKQQLRAVIDTIGADRVLLGTDYPADMGLIDPKNWIIDNALLTGVEKSAILSGNAARLLRA